MCSCCKIFIRGANQCSQKSKKGMKTHTFSSTKSALYVVFLVLKLQLKTRKPRHEVLLEQWNVILDAGLTVKRIKTGWHLLNQINSQKKKL